MVQDVVEDEYDRHEREREEERYAGDFPPVTGNRRGKVAKVFGARNEEDSRHEFEKGIDGGDFFAASGAPAFLEDPGKYRKELLPSENLAAAPAFAASSEDTLLSALQTVNDYGSETSEARSEKEQVCENEVFHESC